MKPVVQETATLTTSLLSRVRRGLKPSTARVFLATTIATPPVGRAA
nr:MAG TPA: hypothetical protein [Caudoviricetes sp.]